jgi:hypothetical protein
MRVGFWYENRKEMYHEEDPEVYGRIILKWILEKEAGDMDYIYLFFYLKSTYIYICIQEWPRQCHSSLCSTFS